MQTTNRCSLLDLINYYYATDKAQLKGNTAVSSTLTQDPELR